MAWHFSPPHHHHFVLGLQACMWAGPAPVAPAILYALMHERGRMHHAHARTHAGRQAHQSCRWEGHVHSKANEHISVCVWGARAMLISVSCASLPAQPLWRHRGVTGHWPCQVLRARHARPGMQLRCGPAQDSAWPCLAHAAADRQRAMPRWAAFERWHASMCVCERGSCLHVRGLLVRRRLLHLAQRHSRHAVE